MRRILIALTFALTGVHGVPASQAITPAEVEAPVTWGAVSNVAHVRDLWCSGQPDRKTLEEAVEHGVKVVINLRDPSEDDWNEKEAAEGLGLVYYNVPMAKKGPKGPFSAEAIDRVDALVKKHGGEETLIHCSSGNRAAGWLAVHLAEEQGTTVDDALEVGRKAGITKGAVEKKVREYIATHPASR